MKLPLPSALLAASAFVAACSPDQQERDWLQGYGEVRYVYIASEDGGRITGVSIEEGQRVSAGDLAFALDADRTRIGLRGAEAAANASIARLDEGGALDQLVRGAEAEAVAARAALERTRSLFARGFVAQARLDADEARSRAADAALNQARANRDVARKDAETTRAAVELWSQKAEDTQIRSPQSGVVERVYRRVGEVVAPGEPLAALATAEGMRVRFFVPEARLGAVQLGYRVAFTCDGCPEGLGGAISFIAVEPQFTPPVIYSREERGKLVFAAEARPDDPFAVRPGLPVEVRVAP